MEPEELRFSGHAFYTSIEPFYPKEYYIYWQSQHESNIVVHTWSKGKQESQYQTLSFRNRTKIFPDQLSFGNLSLVIEPLMLEDDQLSLEVTVSGNKPTKKLCQMTLYIAGTMLSTLLSMPNEKLKLKLLLLC